MGLRRLHPGRWLATAALLAATAPLGLSACGGSSAHSSTSASATSSSPPQSSSATSSASSQSSSATASSSTSSGASQSSASASAGKPIFLSAGCGSCHTLAAANTSGQVGPNLDQLKPSYAAVVSQVTSGGNGMPSFAGKLTTPQIRSVARFVASATQ
jgi:mono/diheme cytochrome c family protein